MSRINELIQFVREKFPEASFDKEVEYSGFPGEALKHCQDKARVDLSCVNRRQAIDLFERTLDAFPDITGAELQGYHVPVVTAVNDQPQVLPGDWNYCLEFRIEDPEFEFIRLANEEG